MSNTQSNVARIRQRVAEAARRAGRDPSGVTIIAVSKTRTLPEIKSVLEQGILHLGENRLQEMAEKYPSIEKSATWHLIGSLQTNKVKQAVTMANLIHTVDRESLADELAVQAERRGEPVECLVQVNVSGEASKHGIASEELVAFLRRISSRGQLRVCGLMTMAPFDEKPEAARPHFRHLRELADQARTLGLPNVTMEHLSMGMSGDFEVAVEEGATLVRIGTAIFGARS